MQSHHVPNRPRGSKLRPAVVCCDFVSKDGTLISASSFGSGPPVILIDGALCYRGVGPNESLSKKLARNFTVYTYDRRGRGRSADSGVYDVRREIEDIESLLAASGGHAQVIGISSGALLALEAANTLAGIKSLALYEPPVIVDSSRISTESSWDAIVAEVLLNRRDEALQLFLQLVGTPRLMMWVLRITPMWRKLRAIAHTLTYDEKLVSPFQRGAPIPTDRWKHVTAPTLVIAGAKSPPWMHTGAKAVAEQLQEGVLLLLPEANHMVKGKLVAPLVCSFFESAGNLSARSNVDTH